MARLLIDFPLVCYAFLRSCGHFTNSSLVSGSENQWKAPQTMAKKTSSGFQRNISVTPIKYSERG